MKYNEVQNLYNVPQNDFKAITNSKLAYQPIGKIREEQINYRAPQYPFEKLVPQLKSCRFIYSMLLEKETNIQICQENKWEDKLSSELDWKTIFSQILKITIDTKLRSFQYKYFMHIARNKKIKYDMTYSILCDLCNS